MVSHLGKLNAFPSRQFLCYRNKAERANNSYSNIENWRVLPIYCTVVAPILKTGLGQQKEEKEGHELASQNILFGNHKTRNLNSIVEKILF